MLNRVYRPTHLMPSHQSHETVPSRNRSRHNQRTPMRWFRLADFLFERGLHVVTFEQAIDYRYIST